MINKEKERQTDKNNYTDKYIMVYANLSNKTRQKDLFFKKNKKTTSHTQKKLQKLLTILCLVKKKNSLFYSIPFPKRFHLLKIQHQYQNKKTSHFYEVSII